MLKMCILLLSYVCGTTDMTQKPGTTSVSQKTIAVPPESVRINLKT